MAHDSNHDLDEILTHRAWVAGLARSLLFDQAQVDDVVQDTWLVALKSRPRDPAATRAWLGGIVRNLVGRRVRGDGRRRRRETAAAVPEEAPDVSTAAGAGGASGVDDLVAQAELHRALVDAVLALDEPYRSTVLMRYFRDLSAEDIARETGVPGSTVRNRLRRALELLRVRLDRTAGGGGGSGAGGSGGEGAAGGDARRAWMLAVMPLALAPELAAGAVAGAAGVGVATGAGTGTAAGTATATATGTLKAATALGTGVALMTAKTKLLSGVAVLLASVFGVWWALDTSDGAVVGAPEGGAVGMVVPAGVEPGVPDAGRNAALPTVEAPEVQSLAADPSGAAVALEPEGDLVTGLVLDAEGAPLPGAQVRLGWNSNDSQNLLGVSGKLTYNQALRTPPGAEHLTDDAGRFAFRFKLGTYAKKIQRTLLAVLHPDHVTRVHVNAPIILGDLPPAPTPTAGEPGAYDARTVDLGTIRMAPGATVVGRVVDESGAPLSGVIIEQLVERPITPGDVRSGGSLDAEQMRMTRRLVVRAFSGTDGRFALRGLAPGQVDLKLWRTDTGQLAVTDLILDAARPLDVGTWTLGAGRSISGVVRGPDGEPLAGAEVTLIAEEAPDWWKARRSTEVAERVRGQMNTDADGRFRFGGLADALFEVHAHSPGMAFTHLPGVFPDEPPLDIALLPPGEVLLHVVDALTGDPLTGARFSTSLPERYDELEYFTDARLFRLFPEDPAAPGQHRITGAGREGMRVHVHLDGFPNVVAEVPPVASGETLEYVVRMEQALTLPGFVIDDRDEPIEGAPVQVAIRVSGQKVGPTSMAMSEADGSYALQGTAGEWVLWTNHPGHLSAQTQPPVTMPRSGDKPFVIRLSRAAALEGLVSDEHGQPAPGVSIVALPHAVPDTADRWRNIPVALATPPPHREKVTQSDENGVYRFLELPPADWTLLATRTPDLIVQRFHYAGGLPADLPEESVVAHALPGETTELPLQLAVDARVMGRITDHGKSLAGALVRLVPTADTAERWLPAAKTRTDALGLYTLEVPVEGPAVLVVSADGGYPHLKPVELMKREPALADLDISGKTLSGRVIDALSREPLAGAQVEINARIEGDWWAPAFPGMDAPRTNRLSQEALQFRIQLTTDSDGRFDALNLPASDYGLRASATAHIADTEYVEVFGGDDDPQPVTIALPRAAIVTGTVTRRDGTPMEHVLVELHPRGDNDRVAGRGYPEDGRWTIDPVDAGSWELRLVTWDSENTVLATEFITVGVGDAPVVEFVVD